MNDWHDERTETLLRRHLAQELDQHAGKAARRFAQHLAVSADAPATTTTQPARPAMRLAGDGPDAAQKRRDRDKPWFSPMWTVGLAGAAMAAVLTIVSMRHTLTGPSSARPGQGSGVRQPEGFQQASLPVRRGVSLRTEDQGLVRFSDGTAARKLLEHRMDKARWYDPKRKAEYEVIVPSEKTVYVGYDRH